MRTSPKTRLSSWTQLRFSIIGGLLANPPKTGELCERLEILASRSYQHPTKDTLVTFGTSTIERWYYNALKSTDPIEALVEGHSELGDSPSYSTVQRRMKERRWYKKTSIRNKTKGQKLAEERLEHREVRNKCLEGLTTFTICRLL